MKDAATFFETEVPEAPEWTFGPEQATAITCPVLSVLGSNSSPLFAEGRQLLHAWFPDCQDADIAGVTHLLRCRRRGRWPQRSPPSCDGASLRTTQSRRHQ